MRKWLAVAVVAAISIVGFAPGAQAGVSPGPDGSQPVLVSAGGYTCAVRENGLVYCFGANSEGQLGRNDTSVHLNVAPVYNVSNAAAVYGSAYHVCAVLEDRTAECWGDGGYGRLGNGTSSGYQSATPVTGLTKISTMALSRFATCAVRQDGSVWCWGYGGFAQFPGTVSNQTTPYKIPGLSSVVQIAVGDEHACAIKVDRSVWCWGMNTSGQLGDGGVSESLVPKKVAGLTDAVAITAGYYTTCAVRSGGGVVCWGHNPNGLTGTGLPASVVGTPTAVRNVTGATGVTLGAGTACAWGAGTVKCWGAGASGQRGDAQLADSPRATTVEYGKPKPTWVAAAAYTTCEIADGGRVWCWGFNGSGEAGTGNTATAYTGAGPGSSFGYAATPTTAPLKNSAPGKPSGSSTGAKKVKISWSAPSTSNGTSAPTDYVVQYRVKGSSTWKTFKDSVTATRSATVTGLTSGKYYYFRVYPKNWAGTGTVSASSSAIKSK
ncbi:fibronectin type III domain-containing protein [Demequina sp.]|uniref:fibronectin type III domain-containing protein n=1 Tax=Demequina sp. TaxID=2050685 RepID=UPI003D1015DC